ncbi:MAG TPA: hypothetical protein VFQ61_28105 [Polyangiaceae bacterium]|nr:hypothetical protein [Polyangiaceae bacterium]
MKYLPLALLVVACYSPGPYGYSRVYSPLDAEEHAAETAREYDPVMAQRAPADWKKTPVSVFGIVKNRQDGPGGLAQLTLGIRTLADRNLCDDADEESCRVTIGEREHAVIHAQVKLLGEDDLGRRRVQPGSLVRVIGRLRDDRDPADGEPVLSGDYYRHFPRGEYVTRGDSEHMRR